MTEIRIALVLFIVACGHRDGGGGVNPDAGDAADGALGGPDAGGGDAAAPDPATCPIGPLDGCCPLLKTGGSDPDCPSLACPTLRRGDPILLEDLVGGARGGEWKGATGIAWTGHELALARTDWDMDGTTRSIVFERRGADGTQTFGPIRVAETASGVPGYPAQAALAYEPTSGIFVYANSTQPGYDAVGLDASGTRLFNTDTAFQHCNWNAGGWVDVMPAGGQLLLLGSRYTCAGSTQTPRITEISTTGQRGRMLDLGDGDRPLNSWYPSATCDLGCAHPSFVWQRSYEGTLRFRRLDATSFVPETGADLASGLFTTGYNGTAIASDGVRMFILHVTGGLSSNGTGLRFQLYQPGMGWIGSPYVSSSTSVPNMLHMLWTGDGWLVAVTAFVPMFGENYAPIGNPERYSVRLYHFAADGAFRESFDLDSSPSIHPYLAWAGGRIAITWVRPGVSGAEPRRYLRYLDCP
jgi:hypothetical protein